MIAAKRAAAYDVELNQLFAAFNLRGDGVIHKDEFYKAQSFMTKALGGFDDQACVWAPQSANMPPVPSLAVQELVLPLKSSKPPRKHLRTGRSRSLSNPCRHTPSQPDRKGTPSPAELNRAMLRSPSVEKQCGYDFKSVDLDGDNGISFEEFKRWQLSLLEVSKKSSATKKHRLVCLTREMQKTGASDAWRRCAWDLETATSAADLENALATAYGLGMSQLEIYEERFLDALQKDALNKCLKASQDICWWNALAAVKRVKERAAEAGATTELFIEHKQRIHEWQQGARNECLSELAKAATEGKLSSAIEHASQVLEEEELKVHRVNLAEMQKPFMVHVMTFSGQNCSVEVSRSQSVGCLKKQVAEHFAVQAYRISLVCESDRLEPDSRLLEDCGVVSMDFQIAAILGAEDHWQEVPISEVLDAAVARRICSIATRKRFEAGELTEEDCRAMLAPELKTLDDQEAEKKRLAAEAEAERQRKAQEAAAEIRRQASERQAARQLECSRLSFQALLGQAVDMGILTCRSSEMMLRSCDEQCRFIQVQLVEHVALQNGIEQEKSGARNIQEQCVVDEMEAKGIASRAEAIKWSAQMDLDEALPALDSAMKRLKSLRLADLCEIRAFARPPRLCTLTLEAVCILFEIRPHRRLDHDHPGRAVNDYYEVAKRDLLGDPSGFMQRLFEYDKDNIPEQVIRRLQPYIDDEDFVPEKVCRVSTACHALCLWVKAMERYHHISRRVDPKRQELMRAEWQLQMQMNKIKKGKEDLENVRSAIANLERELEIRGQFTLPDHFCDGLS